MDIRKFVPFCLSLLLSLSMFGTSLPQIREAKASLSGSWYMVQMDSHSDYSGYLPVDEAKSLYQMAKVWSDAGYDAVVFKDYHEWVVESGYKDYTTNTNFDSSSGYYNYSVSGSPSKSVADFNSRYPSISGGSGSGRLYIKGTGKAMVSYYHSTNFGRRSLDLYRHQIIDRWLSYTDSFNGNVSMGIEIRFTSGKKYVVCRLAGSASYTNTSDTKYFTTTLDGGGTKFPFTDLDEWLIYCEAWNPELNITDTFIELWNQSEYLNDNIFDFLWFVESFDSDSWVDIYFDGLYWRAYSNWDNYLADIALAENDHEIIIVPGLEVTQGPGKNQAFFFNVNSSAENVYDGSISQYLNLPTEASDRGGLAFTEELYKYPNGTDYPDLWASVNITDWLNRGFKGRAIRYSQWDNALTVAYNNEWTSDVHLDLIGSDFHNGTLEKAMKTSYTMVYVEGDLTKANIVSAIEAGHFYAVEHHDEDTVRTNLTITKFDINNQWTMSDWATPNNRATLNIEVECDVPISDITLIWNEQQLRNWTPNTKSISTSIDVSFGGYFRLIAKDENSKYTAYSNAIFIKPTSPYVTQTTHPLDFSATYTSNKMTVNVTAPALQISSTKVYCGDREEPVAIYTVNGTLTWSYNVSTTILTLNVTHVSPTRILIYWKFPCDVNDDGIVDVADLALMSKAYGATPGNPNWDEGCDINGDEIVDKTDLSITGENYGKCQPL